MYNNCKRNNLLTNRSPEAGERGSDLQTVKTSQYRYKYLDSVFNLRPIAISEMSTCSLCLTVRLHDSISEEGFHYLVFDLWVSVTTCMHVRLLSVSESCLVWWWIGASFDLPLQGHWRRAVWRYCRKRILQWSWCQVSKHRFVTKFRNVIDTGW